MQLRSATASALGAPVVGLPLAVSTQPAAQAAPGDPVPIRAATPGSLVLVEGLRTLPHGRTGTSTAVGLGWLGFGG